MSRDSAATARTHRPAAGEQHASLASVADEELRWFFSVPVDITGGSRVYRQIRRWLLAIPERDAGVLKAAYTPGPWPDGLGAALGRLTGILVRLVSAEAGWPEQSWDRDLLEARTAKHLEASRAKVGSGVLAPYREQAIELLKTARNSYLRERGVEPCAVGRRA
jgi:hypothetical protein